MQLVGPLCVGQRDVAGVAILEEDDVSFIDLRG